MSQEGRSPVPVTDPDGHRLALRALDEGGIDLWALMCEAAERGRPVGRQQAGPAWRLVTLIEHWTSELKGEWGPVENHQDLAVKVIERAIKDVRRGGAEANDAQAFLSSREGSELAEAIGLDFRAFRRWVRGLDEPGCDESQ